MTAYGTWCGILAALAWRAGLSADESLNADVFKDRVIAVQGLGHVGMDLCQQLHESGAKLIVTDVNSELVEHACREFNARAISPDDIVTADAEVFAPCALGGILNSESIPTLQATIVAGAANNQLAEDQDGVLLHERDVLYAPDFVINAGGIINIANEHPSYDVARARAQTAKLATTLRQIFEHSKALNRPTSEVADELAQQRLA